MKWIEILIKLADILFNKFTFFQTDKSSISNLNDKKDNFEFESAAADAIIIWIDEVTRILQ